MVWNKKGVREALWTLLSEIELLALCTYEKESLEHQLESVKNSGLRFWLRQEESWAWPEEHGTQGDMLKSRWQRKR